MIQDAHKLTIQAQLYVMNFIDHHSRSINSKSSISSDYFKKAHRTNKMSFPDPDVLSNCNPDYDIYRRGGGGGK